MTDDTKRELAGLAGTLAIIAGALLVGLYSVKPFRMTWTDPNPPTPGLTAEFWASTNLVDWYWKTNVPAVPGSNFLALPIDRPAEFFKVRNRLQQGTNFIWSDWSRNGP